MGSIGFRLPSFGITHIGIQVDNYTTKRFDKRMQNG
jgi:hypothetical protein